MKSSFFNFFIIFFIVILFLSLSCFVPIIYSSSSSLVLNNNIINTGQIIYSSYGFAWPTPGYTTITSYFGYRKAPTARFIYISLRY